MGTGTERARYEKERETRDELKRRVATATRPPSSPSRPCPRHCPRFCVRRVVCKSDDVYRIACGVLHAATIGSMRVGGVAEGQTLESRLPVYIYTAQNAGT